MNVFKGITYITLLSLDTLKFKINHFMESLDFHKRIEREQERRHKEYEEYCKRYLECIEKAKTFEK